MSESNQKSVKVNRPNQHRGPMRGGVGFEKPKHFKKSMAGLLKYLKPYLIAVGIALLLSVGSAVCAVLAPGYLKDITEILAAPIVTATGVKVDFDAISDIAIVLVVFYSCACVFNYLQNYIMSKVNQHVCHNLRREISVKINKVPLKYFDSTNYGDVLSRITNDVDTIGQTLNQSVTQLVRSVSLFVGVIIAMLVTSWELGLTAFATVPFSLGLVFVIIKLSQKWFVQQQQKLGQLNAHIEEMYSGANVVKAFNGEEKSLAQFDEVNNGLFKSAWLSQFLSGLMMPTIGFVSNLGIAAVCLVGAILVLDHGYGVGVMAAFFIYVRIFQDQLGQLAQVGNTLQSTAAASERVFEFLAEGEGADESHKSAKVESPRGAVEFRNVRFGYDKDVPVIKDFSASVLPGQKVAIVGPTGAGKTTLVNLLMRFYETDSGDIIVDGVNIKDMRREDVRALIGMVLQDTWLFEGTVKENIVYNMQDVSKQDVVDACKLAGIDHYIRTQAGGYNMVLDNDTLISSGQKQLLTIARAMIQNSPMLILDEATSSVDTRTEQIIQRAMDALTKGRTSFVIAHRLSTIKNADLILVMQNGDIIEKGNHEELIGADGFYAELYKSQFANE